jgi:hypothetical protein
LVRLSLFLSRPLQALALILLVSLAALGQKIHVNKYDPNADFSKFKTYSWAPHGAVAHPMLAADIVGTIEDELTQKGLTKVTSNPDLIIQVYGSIDQESSFTSNDPLYNATGGIPPFDPSFSGPVAGGHLGQYDNYHPQGRIGRRSHQCQRQETGVAWHVATKPEHQTRETGEPGARCHCENVQTVSVEPFYVALGSMIARQSSSPTDSGPLDVGFREVERFSFPNDRKTSLHQPLTVTVASDSCQPLIPRQQLAL